MRIPFSRPLAVVRQTGYYSETTGRWVPGPETTIPIEGSSQPFTTREMLLLPEGTRTRERLKIYTQTPILPRGHNQAADRIVIDGVQWEVETVENYFLPGYGIRHYKVIVIIPDEAESA